MSSSDGLISFARGAPSLDLIPVDDLRACADAALRQDPGGALSYGNAAGYLPLREWIATSHGVEVDQVLATNGSLQADMFLFDHVIEAGDVAVVEAPTYDRTLLALRQRGAEVVPVALDEEGIRTDDLAAAIEGRTPKLAHIIPNFQNPAGMTLSQPRREGLLDLARDRRFLIFEDDPYKEIRFEGEALPTMLSLARDDQVVYASSFTKTVCPGVRVGYLVGPAPIIAALTTAAMNTYIGPGQFAQATVAEFCRSGRINESIASIRAALKQRCEVLCEALSRELPEARFTPPQGGYFLWVELPGDVDVARLHDAAREQGVAFVKGTDFFLEGGEHSLRMAFSAVTPPEIEEGVRRLARARESLHAAA